MSSYFIYIAALKTVYKVPHSQTELEEVETRRQKKKKKKKKKAQTHTYTYMHTYIDTHIGLIKIYKSCSSTFMIKLTYVADGVVIKAGHLL